MDDIDKAQERAEQFLQHSINQRALAPLLPAPTGARTLVASANGRSHPCCQRQRAPALTAKSHCLMVSGIVTVIAVMIGSAGWD